MKKMFYLLVILALFASCDQPNNEKMAGTATEAEMKSTASNSVASILDNATLAIDTTGMERYTSWYTETLIDAENNITAVQCATMFIAQDNSKATMIISSTWDGILNG